jgi:Tfp pilus assembly ATPase PilU
MHGHAANRALKPCKANHITHIPLHDNSSTFSVDKTLAFHPKSQSDQASLPHDYFFITR